MKILSHFNPIYPNFIELLVLLTILAYNSWLFIILSLVVLFLNDSGYLSYFLDLPLTTCDNAKIRVDIAAILSRPACQFS
jgi:general stress protein CsbA